MVTRMSVLDLLQSAIRNRQSEIRNRNALVSQKALREVFMPLSRYNLRRLQDGFDILTTLHLGKTVVPVIQSCHSTDNLIQIDLSC
jgi:hypothetical protein